jgi:hypothetical protein
MFVHIKCAICQYSTQRCPPVWRELSPSLDITAVPWKWTHWGMLCEHWRYVLGRRRVQIPGRKSAAGSTFFFITCSLQKSAETFPQIDLIHVFVPIFTWLAHYGTSLFKIWVTWIVWSLRHMAMNVNKFAESRGVTKQAYSATGCDTDGLTLDFMETEKCTYRMQPYIYVQHK